MQHLIVDAFVAPDAAAQLGELQPMFELLDELPAEIAMTKIAPPYVFRYMGAKPDDWGVSGFVAIAESHISIHTFPEHRRFHLDIFSCRTFDASEALAGVERRLRVVHRVAQVLRRPVDPGEAMSIRDVGNTGVPSTWQAEPVSSAHR